MVGLTNLSLSQKTRRQVACMDEVLLMTRVGHSVQFFQTFPSLTRACSLFEGPILGWLNVIEAHKATDTELPVNLVMCFEGMEESGSEGLEELVVAEAQQHFKDVDAVCISDNYWLGVDSPCITYGLRGLAYFSVNVSGPKADLHSGVFGNTVHEPMTDLFALFSKLVTPQGKILIPGINEKVAPLTEEERKLYKAINVSVGDFENAIGAKTTIHDNKVDCLMGRMRYPSEFSPL